MRLRNECPILILTMRRSCVSLWFQVIIQIKINEIKLKFIK
jgi:hypothetical protein